MPSIFVFLITFFLVGLSSGFYETSWHFYGDEECCTSNKYKGVISEFTCGHLYYNTMYIDHDTRRLFLGAMDAVYRLNLDDISLSDCQRDSLRLEATNIVECIISGKNEDYECRNHINIIEDIGNDLLYICGTNAYNPRDIVIYKSTLKHLPRHIHYGRVGVGEGRCPGSPGQKFASMWSWGGGGSSSSGLYSALIAGKGDISDPLLVKWHIDNTTEPSSTTYIRTIKYDTKWLNSPEFISLQQIGDWVYTFLQEKASCSSQRNPVIARVCTSDTGASKRKHHFTSFTKAKISCAGEHFNRMEDVSRVDDGESIIHILFSSGTNSPMPGSVICQYSLEGLKKPFEGAYASGTTHEEGWAKVPDHVLPETLSRHVYSCENITRMPDSAVNFLRSHPMMYDSVEPNYGKPVFSHSMVIFKMAVDRVDRGRDQYVVYYLAAGDGKIHKVVQWSENGLSESSELDIWNILPEGEIISEMKISSFRSLYVATSHRIKQIKLEELCSRQYNTCIRCSKDPYCGWNVDEEACMPYRKGLFQDVRESSAIGCDAFISAKQVPTTFGQSVHLGNYITTPAIMKPTNFQWRKYQADSKKTLIEYSPQKYIFTMGGGLVIIDITDKDQGIFECRYGKRLVSIYNLTVDSGRCDVPLQNSSYHKVYLDWCREFVKHKEAMKHWQNRKKQQCQRPEIDWNDRRSNEVYTNN